MGKVEQLIAEMKSLTPGEQKRILEELGKSARTAQLREIQGKYASLTVSSETFAKRKLEEIELE